MSNLLVDKINRQSRRYEVGIGVQPPDIMAIASVCPEMHFGLQKSPENQKKLLEESGTLRRVRVECVVKITNLTTL